MSLVPLVPLVQGWTKITFPGCVSMGLNNCVYLPATGAKNAIISPHIHRTWEGYFSPALYAQALRSTKFGMLTKILGDSCGLSAGLG